MIAVNETGGGGSGAQAGSDPDNPWFGSAYGAKISNSDFLRLGRFIHGECGIKMPDAKKSMVEARLKKRLKALGMDSFRDYCDYLFSKEGIEHELVHMLDAITTNKTDFFREPKHFEYLTDTVLPELVGKGAGIRRRLSIWSAGCSTGEEPYTLAMILSEFAERWQGFYYSILATDISSSVLGKAKRAIYEGNKIEPVPEGYKKKYLLRSKDRSKKLVRIVPALRAKIDFRRLNLKEGSYDLEEPMDIIFYRNVMIYFDRPTQEAILNRLCRYMHKGGYLFTGHSETLHGMDVPLRQAATTIYRRAQ